MQKEKIVLKLQTKEPVDGPVYVAGNFNEWTAADSSFEMQQSDNGGWKLEFELDSNHANLIYKYTLGSWKSVELDESGHDTPNRQFLPNQRVRRDFVPRWKEDLNSAVEDRHPIIEVIDDDFEFPEWVKTRRVAALLPYDYHQTNKSYPVLFLQDGQNLFDDFAPYGNWALDHHLADLALKDHHEVIIIAIDHAEHQRIKEYTPSIDTKLGVGQGKDYVRFLVEVLVPVVSKLFRTKPGREHWGIGGSSMGGLMTLYAGLTRPDVFSKMMVFSPSLWVAPDLHKVYLPKGEKSKLYLYAGEKESEALMDRIETFKNHLFNVIDEEHTIDYHEVVNPEGTHSEYFWGEAFPKAMSWLYFSRECEKEQLHS